MRIPIHQIDAFADRPFRGNPAAVCPLERWLDDRLMQAVAAENNLAETAFLVPEGEGDYGLRWFTPTVEVDLCGHATLASAHLVLGRLAPERDAVAFETRSGRLTVRRDGPLLTMDLPAYAAAPATAPEGVIAAMGGAPREVHRANYLMLVYEREAEVRALSPDVRALAAAGTHVIATAPGEAVDFVSRFFAPAAGIDEDPVTGSAHCALAPYWAARLGRTRLQARQLSRRGGDLVCEPQGDRVLISGACVEVMEGHLHLPGR